MAVLESARRHTGAARARAGFGSHQPPSTNKFGRRALGHIHDTGVAGLMFPREIHDQLIFNGWAKQHGGGFVGVVSYHIREPEDVPGVVELFRMNYERA